MQKTVCLLLLVLAIGCANIARAQSLHSFNEAYKGRELDMVAFPIGGLGAGMFCLDGTGTLSHLSIRNTPDVFNTPRLFAAMSIKGAPEFTRVLEGPVPGWKRFSVPNGGHGVYGTTIGLARFREASFKARFPFAEVDLKDSSLPVSVTITGWSPFIPTDADHSSLPVGGLEYEFTNTSKVTRDIVFSFNSYTQRGLRQVVKMDKGFILSNDSVNGGPEVKGDLAFYTDEPKAVVDYCWFRGGFYDALNVLWKSLQEAQIHTADVQHNSPGASLYVPFSLRPGEKKKIRLMVSWYVPDTKLRFQDDVSDPGDSTVRDGSVDLPSRYHKPWYSSQWGNIGSLTDYWRRNYDSLRTKSMLFRETFYKSTLPAEVIEAVTANFSTLKSPTILRQYDGRLWAWEGCEDNEGSCPGSCTHVWNYAQAMAHLFPSLERGLRETEFFESQNVVGHQQFRSALPIRPTAHNFYAAADGQLGGVMKVYRDWRVSGDSAWLRRLFPRVRSSLDYCIRTWDPGRLGKMEEPHHNTYDVEFWGADGMTQSYYLGALEAFTRIGEYLREDVADYQSLLVRARSFTEDSLYNGQYFVQRIQWKGLNAADPVSFSAHSLHSGYSPEALVLLQQEGPKYQYGTGCLSDGVAGDWLALVCGLPEPLTKEKVVSHLESVYRYNFRRDLSAHSNPDRPGYALGNEGGLLLCSWPLGSSLSLPFVFSTETWTGIEYEVASHLIFEGKVKEGLDLVKTCRRRYDGQVRNPFDEYECGHWYARALSSYALLEALTGVRYDAVNQTLYVRSRVGNFVSFLSTDTGWGNVIFKDGKATVDVVYGRIPVRTVRVEK
jgi:uncharacterized protein (DUF608 family)